ncbi:hypothetical protein ASPFODRAFT_484496 [Aspergillus luchuensis CBS 106.47]|uniref:Uncharacterized protein n=1 Tax=Aspergillus luchuensis (strain CBS 106.47) TaxID=1137211 RepID=A0A1M3TR70_ASPLC|nr:hypothetical protein ASPFODRAFT_484496 [Aspergillus luchuensis CBS 106.47]
MDGWIHPSIHSFLSLHQCISRAGRSSPRLAGFLLSLSPFLSFPFLPYYYYLLLNFLLSVWVTSSPGDSSLFPAHPLLVSSFYSSSYSSSPLFGSLPSSVLPPLLSLHTFTAQFLPSLRFSSDIVRAILHVLRRIGSPAQDPSYPCTAFCCLYCS